MRPGIYLINDSGEATAVHDEAGDGDLKVLDEYVDEHIDGVELSSCIEASTYDIGPLSIPSRPPAWLYFFIAALPFGVIALGAQNVTTLLFLGALAFGVGLGKTLEEGRC